MQNILEQSIRNGICKNGLHYVRRDVSRIEKRALSRISEEMKKDEQEKMEQYRKKSITKSL